MIIRRKCWMWLQEREIWQLLLKKGTGSKVVGLDLSQQMLNVGVIKIKNLN